MYKKKTAISKRYGRVGVQATKS